MVPVAISSKDSPITAHVGAVRGINRAAAAGVGPVVPQLRPDLHIVIQPEPRVIGEIDGATVVGPVAIKIHLTVHVEVAAVVGVQRAAVPAGIIGVDVHLGTRSRVQFRRRIVGEIDQPAVAAERAVIVRQTVAFSSEPRVGRAHDGDRAAVAAGRVFAQRPAAGEIHRSTVGIERAAVRARCISDKSRCVDVDVGCPARRSDPAARAGNRVVIDDLSAVAHVERIVIPQAHPTADIGSVGHDPASIQRHRTAVGVDAGAPAAAARRRGVIGDEAVVGQGQVAAANHISAAAIAPCTLEGVTGNGCGAERSVRGVRQIQSRAVVSILTQAVPIRIADGAVVQDERTAAGIDTAARGVRLVQKNVTLEIHRAVLGVKAAAVTGPVTEGEDKQREADVCSMRVEGAVVSQEKPPAVIHGRVQTYLRAFKVDGAQRGIDAAAVRAGSFVAVHHSRIQRRL